MTPILFLVVFFLGLLLNFLRHPIYGLYAYLFAFYMAPSYNWWRNEVPDLRYLQLAAVAALAASLWKRDESNRLKWYQTGGGKLFLLFVLYNWAQVLWALDREVQIEGATLYTKHLLMFYLVYRLADSLERIKDIALAHVVGCGWFGYQSLGAGGGRLEDLGGPVAGANELGLHVATGILFGGILFLGLRGMRRWVAFACLPLILNCLILTISRGAFLGVIAGGMAGFFAVPGHLAKRYIACGALGLVLFGMLAHDDLVERFTETYIALTTDEVELDNSAAGRSGIAAAGFRMGLDYPLGAGHKATADLARFYMSEELLDVSGRRAAHNTSAGVIAEHGFSGLALYYLTILWVLLTMYRMRRLQGSPELRETGLCATFVAASLIAVYTSCNFSNDIDLETQYWCLALLAAVYEQYKLRVAQTVPVVAESRAQAGGALAHKLR